MSNWDEKKTAPRLQRGAVISMAELIVDCGELKLHALPAKFTTRDFRSFASQQLNLDKGESLILLLALVERGVLRRRGFSKWAVVEA